MAPLKNYTTENDWRIRKFIVRILKAFSWGAQVCIINVWIKNRNRTLDSESATYESESDSDANLHDSDSKSDSTTDDSESGIKSGFGFVL